MDVLIGCCADLSCCVGLYSRTGTFLFTFLVTSTFLSRVRRYAVFLVRSSVFEVVFQGRDF